MITKKNFVSSVPDRMPFITGLDKSKYNLSISVFFDSSWVGTNTDRHVVFRFSGDGVRTEYEIDNPNVVRAIAEGHVFVSHNYNLVGDNRTRWIHGSGTSSFRPFQYSIRNAIEAQSSLETFVEKAEPTLGFPVKKIFFTGQSRGATTILSWTAFSRTDWFRKYYDRVGGIISNVPSLMSAEPDGWKQPHFTMQMLEYGVNNNRHPIILVMNDGDWRTCSDYRRRVQSSIGKRVLNIRTSPKYFYNFTDQGHSTDLDFNHAMIHQWINNVPLEYNGELLQREE